MTTTQDLVLDPTPDDSGHGGAVPSTLAPTSPSHAAAPGTPSRLSRLVRGRPEDAAWVRPAVLALLAGTCLLYVWGLGASGYANSFYSAAVQAGSVSWKAFFFGSFDSSNLITVDKPPASLWVMGLSARMFGVNAWSILVPQALEGVAAVGVLYLAVRRWFGATAGLIAGAVLALTPVAVLMFRFNNPDALLVLLLVGAAYAMTRGLEDGRTRWLVLAATLIGFGFLTKMMQAFVVVPGFAFVYLLAAPVALRKRLWQLVVAGAVMLVSAGWWVAIVELMPASARPYIGGSQHNSVVELIFGYNGLGRITGNETGSVGGGGQGTGMWGETGWSRMFSPSFGGQISWLIPSALVLMVGMLWLTRRSPRTDRRRSATLLWGSWLIVTGITFSYAQGIIHEYYSVALAPAIGALVGIGAVTFWKVRRLVLARAVLAAAVLAAAWWSAVLLGRSADWHPWIRTAVVVAGVLTAAALALPPRTYARATAVVVVAALFVGLAGPVAYALQTASVAHGGSLPTAGPTVSGGNRGGPGGQMRGQGPGQGQPGQGQLQGGPGTANGMPGMPPGGFGAMPGQGGTQGFGQNRGGGTTGGGTQGGVGGLLNASTPSSELVALLKADASSYTWVAAAVGSNNAAGAQLATGEPVMSIGGFNGTDPAPTLAQFQQYVAAGKVHYFLGSGGFGGGMNGSQSSSDIASWVAANFTATTVGGTTVYDLTQSTTSSSSTTATIVGA